MYVETYARKRDLTDGKKIKVKFLTSVVKMQKCIKEVSDEDKENMKKGEKCKGADEDYMLIMKNGKTK